MTPRRDPLAGLSPDDTLTIKEAATRLGISERLVRKDIQEGHLPAYIPGGRTGRTSGRMGYRIKPEDLRKWFFGK